MVSMNRKNLHLPLSPKLKTKKFYTKALAILLFDQGLLFQLYANVQ